MVKQIIIDMQKELTKATQNYGRAKASERLAQKKYEDAVKVSADWEGKAKAAISQGNEDLAKRLSAERSRRTRTLQAIRKCMSRSRRRPRLSAIR